STAVVEVEGMKTAQTGELRRYQSPAVPVGKSYYYTIKVSWKDADGKDVSDEKVVRVQPGQETTVDLRPGGGAPPVVTSDKPKIKLDVPFVPTPQEVVEKMLELANVTKDDTVYDLGCGDGRILVTAAKKYGAKGVGIDLDPERVKDSLDNVKKNGVEGQVEIREGNALQVKDLDKASVVTLYLFPQVNLKLRPQLQKELKPGSRVVSHDFHMGDWKPEKKVEMKDDRGRSHTVYLWTIEGEKKEDAKKDEKKDESKKEEPKEAKKPEAKAEPEDEKPDVIFVPTPQGIVDKMLDMAKVKEGDVVYDLGCGDG